MVLKKSKKKIKVKGISFCSFGFYYFFSISVQYYDEEHGFTVMTLVLVNTEANHMLSHLEEILLDNFEAVQHQQATSISLHC